MQIGGLQKLTLIDYPGKIACAVFLIGCNFRCRYCHNPELVLPEKIKKQTRISEKIFFTFLKKQKKLLEAVVVSGGEPTIHQDLISFIKKIKKLGYLIKLDTNGSNPKMLKKLIDEKLIDYAAMDIKAPLTQFLSQCLCRARSLAKRNEAWRSQTISLAMSLPREVFGGARRDPAKSDNFQSSKYDEATGVKVDLEKIKKSVEIIKKSGIDYEFRTTVAPVIHTKEDIVQIAKEISPVRRYCLQNFRSGKTLDPKFEKIKPFTEKQLNSIKKEVDKYMAVALRETVNKPH